MCVIGHRWSRKWNNQTLQDQIARSCDRWATRGLTSTRRWKSDSGIRRDREIMVHNRRAIVAHDHPLIVAMNRPSPDQTTLNFCGDFFFKYWCSSLWNKNFDWFVKQLSEFKGRSWVHHDSLAFRFDRYLIKAWFVVINRRISSNFPFERRTSIEEEAVQIHINPRELKPHLHGNQVSSEIWSIIWWYLSFDYF